MPSQQDNPVVDIVPKSVMGNGVAQVGEDFALADSKSLKKQEDADCSDHSKGMDISGHEEPNDLDTEKVDSKEQKPEQPAKRRGRKSSSSTKSAEPLEGQAVTNEKEAEKTLDSESHIKEVPSSLHEDHSVEAAGPSENDKEIDAKISSPKAGHCDSEAVSSPSPSRGLNDGNRSKKLGRPKTKDGSANEVAVEDSSKKVSDGTSDSEAKLTKKSVKKALGRKSDVRKTGADSVKIESGATSDVDAKKHLAKKVDKSNKSGGGSSSRQPEKKRRGRGKANSETSAAKSSAKDVDEVLLCTFCRACFFAVIF